MKQKPFYEWVIYVSMASWPVMDLPNTRTQLTGNTQYGLDKMKQWRTADILTLMLTLPPSRRVKAIASGHNHDAGRLRLHSPKYTVLSHLGHFDAMFRENRIGTEWTGRFQSVLSVSCLCLQLQRRRHTSEDGGDGDGDEDDGSDRGSHPRFPSSP